MLNSLKMMKRKTFLSRILLIIFFASSLFCFWFFPGLFHNRRHLLHSPGTVSFLLSQYALASWDKLGISSWMMEAAIGTFIERKEAGEGCFLVQCINNTLYTVGEQDNRSEFPGPLLRSRRTGILELLRKYVAKVSEYKVLNFEAIFCLGDCVVSEKICGSFTNIADPSQRIPDPLPIFTIVKCEGSMNIPFPIWDEATGLLSMWNEKVRAFRKSSAAFPWENRVSKAVFRGGQRTCTFYNGSKAIPFYSISDSNRQHAKSCGRNALVHSALTSKFYNRFDVKLTSGYNPLNFEKYTKIAVSYYDSNLDYLSKRDQENYKYQIIAEGHCQWANRLRDAIWSGSVLIIQENKCVEFYGMFLEPWVHYIPVDYTFNNLTNAILWADKHPKEIDEMRVRKIQYALNHVTLDAVHTYVSELINSYIELLLYDVTLREKAELYV